LPAVGLSAPIVLYHKIRQGLISNIQVKIYFYLAALYTGTTFEPKILFPLLSTGYVFHQNNRNSPTD
jgi:hypothetical protein